MRDIGPGMMGMTLRISVWNPCQLVDLLRLDYVDERDEDAYSSSHNG
jgi:hypothetical protein